ncbi:MAG: peptide deformylase [Deltaproteobacteria bacterium]|nr:peptide deformylase [Deltaproteobacteria bacterium]
MSSPFTILTFPDPFLRRKADPVETFDAALAELARQMTAAMYQNEGMGLAAPQVGRSIRLVVTDIFAGDDDPALRKPRVWVNPRLTEQEGEWVGEEGCLSVPEFRADVKRSRRVTVEYQTVEGEHRRETLEGLEAVCLQHEVDHLEGKLFIDYLPPLRRDMVKKRLAKVAAMA